MRPTPIQLYPRNSFFTREYFLFYSGKEKIFLFFRMISVLFNDHFVEEFYGDHEGA